MRGFASMRCVRGRTAARRQLRLWPRLRLGATFRLQAWLAGPARRRERGSVVEVAHGEGVMMAAAGEGGGKG